MSLEALIWPSWEEYEAFGSDAPSLPPEALGLVQLTSMLGVRLIPPPESSASLPLPAAPPFVALVLPLALALISTRPLSIPALTAKVRSWLVTAMSPGSIPLGR